MRSILLFMLAAAFVPSVGQAQGVTSEMCLKLAGAIATGETIDFSNQQFDALKKYAYCGSAAENNSEGLNIGYKAFSLDFSREKARQENVCENLYKSLNYSETDYRKAKQVFDRSLDTIDKCLVLANQQWDVKFTPFSKDAFAVGISHHGGNGDYLKRASIYPQNSLICQGIPSGEERVTTTETVNIECERIPTKQMVGGVEVVTASDATLSLFLGSTPLPLTLPGYGGSPFDQIHKRLDDLSASQSELKAAYDAKIAEFATATGPTMQKRSNNNWEECPPGYYVEAIRGRDVDGGKFCTSCISQIEFRCKKLGN